TPHTVTHNFYSFLYIESASTSNAFFRSGLLRHFLTMVTPLVDSLSTMRSLFTDSTGFTSRRGFLRTTIAGASSLALTRADLAAGKTGAQESLPPAFAGLQPLG